MCEETKEGIVFSTLFNRSERTLEVRGPQEPKQEKRSARRSQEDHKIASEKGPVASSQPADARVAAVAVAVVD